MAAIFNAPFEVLALIFEFCSQATLYSAAQVSQLWNAASTPELYSHIDVDLLDAHGTDPFDQVS